MESKVFGYRRIVVVLGIIAAATGFAGEATKVKASQVYIINYSICIYPRSNPAFALGIISAVITIITRIYISVSFGGAGCCRTRPNSTQISKLLFVFSWVASVVAVVLLLVAAALSNRQDRQYDPNGNITCYVMKPGMFAAGAILSLLSAIFGICDFVTLYQSPQTTMDNNFSVDQEKSILVPFLPQQCPPQRYTTQQY